MASNPVTAAEVESREPKVPPCPEMFTYQYFTNGSWYKSASAWPSLHKVQAVVAGIPQAYRIVRIPAQEKP